MGGDHLVGLPYLHTVRVAPHRHRGVGIRHRHGIEVTLKLHQRILAGKGALRHIRRAVATDQGMKDGALLLQKLAARLLRVRRRAREVFAAAPLQMRVKGVEIGKARDAGQEVPLGQLHEILDTALFMP
jgi:hypothetical protein